MLEVLLTCGLLSLLSYTIKDHLPCSRKYSTHLPSGNLMEAHAKLRSLFPDTSRLVIKLTKRTSTSHKDLSHVCGCGGEGCIHVGVYRYINVQ